MTAFLARWEKEFKMDRAVNLTDGEEWSAASDDEQDVVFESRPVREVRGQGAAAFRIEREAEPRKAEWKSSLLLVQEACEAIKASEERVEALESELEALNTQHRDAFLQMKARLVSAEDQIKAAHARAKAFEERALEAEAWLTRLNQAIVSGFGGSIRREKQGR
jgi:hypothetical protein